MGDLAASLTEKQRLFCLHYLKSFNATQAAKDAGYSEKTAYRSGCDNLKKRQVQAFLSQAVGERIERAEIEADEVLNGWHLLSKADMGDFIDITEDGLARLNLTKVEGTPKTRLIRKFTQRVVGKRGEGKDAEEIIEATLELKDSTKGLEALSKYLHLYQEGQGAGNDGAPAEDADALARTIERLEKFLLGNAAFRSGLAGILRRHPALFQQLAVEVKTG